MIISIRKGWRIIKFLVVFMLLTYVIFHLFSYISHWLEPTQKYKEPEGTAIKVFSQEDAGYGTMKERLRFFYWYGE